jgi:dephospho-CoA kinase
MLRIGLTGSLGSGKSTAARLFAAHGAHILQSDAIGRDLMQPGQPVYAAIVERFGNAIVLPDGQLDRPALAKIAFTDQRVEELNAIVHPAVIARQAELAGAIFESDPHAVLLVESALIFETNYSGANAGDKTRWHKRFDRIILVTAPEEIKIARFIARSAAGTNLTEARRVELEGDARRRLAQQLSDDQKSALADYVLTNDGPVAELEWQVDQLWPILQAAARQPSPSTHDH